MGQDYGRRIPTSRPRFFSVKDAAIYLNVSQQTVRRLMKEGKLKSYTIGRQIRIDGPDLIDYIERNKR
jgi:putative molybdopterin biosynthesis protein